MCCLLSNCFVTHFHFHISIICYAIIPFAGLHRWATGKKDGRERDMQEEFLRNGKAQSMLKAYIQTLLNRENPYTKKLYK